MKLDPSNVRFLTPDHCRILNALEIGSRNHEIVPIQLIVQISKQRKSGALILLSDLGNWGLTERESGNSSATKYEGYRLRTGGYDYLALKALSSAGTVTSVDRQLGVGKESDVYLGYSESERPVALKLHRLGRTSFRNVRNTRDYESEQRATNWIQFSRISAQKEFAFMQALFALDFPVPQPYDCNRHIVVMEVLDEYVPLSQVRNACLENFSPLLQQALDLVVRLATFGLVHGDLNEFNLLVNEAGDQLRLIDFPQMISVDSDLGKEYFDRDVNCLFKYFDKHFDTSAYTVPRFEDVRVRDDRIDYLVKASGSFRHKKNKGD